MENARLFHRILSTHRFFQLRNLRVWYLAGRGSLLTTVRMAVVDRLTEYAAISCQAGMLSCVALSREDH